MEEHHQRVSPSGGGAEQSEAEGGQTKKPRQRLRATTRNPERPPPASATLRPPPPMGEYPGTTPDAGSTHHVPPASSIAFSKARLDGVRFLPELRGRSGSFSSALRLASREPSSAMSTGSRFGLIVLKGMQAGISEFRGFCTCHRNSNPKSKTRYAFG